MTDQEWGEIRCAWETDPRWGCQWLIDEHRLKIGRDAIIKRAQQEGWSKIRDRLTAKLPRKVIAHIMEERKNEPTEENTYPVNDADVGGKYEDWMRKAAYKVALLGGGLEDIADVLEVSPSTVVRWMETKPEFGAVMRKGRMLADANVAHTLYKRATGQEITEYKVNAVNGDVIVTPVPKQVMGDVAAQKFWLINRQPKLWRERVEVQEEVTVSLGAPKEVLEDIYARAHEKLSQQAADMEGRLERLARMGVNINEV